MLEDPGIDWDEYFLKVADVVSEKSRDDTKVGAVVVQPGDRLEDQVIIATGYNGLPRHVADIDSRLDDSQKLQWICHAEANALYNAARVGVSVRNATIYTTLFPCVTCAAALVQAGIRRVCTKGPRWKKDPNDPTGQRARTILAEAGVQVSAPQVHEAAEAQLLAKHGPPHG